ncbi:MAG: hypothetical protein WCT22_02865 [Patescibacteria group bacterium]|jgi:hypothetical protein
MIEALSSTIRTIQASEWTLPPDKIKPKWIAIRSVRSWKKASLNIANDSIRANKLAIRISDRVNYLVSQKKSVTIKIRLDDDQALGEVLEKSGLLSLFETRKFNNIRTRKKKYFGTVELKMIPGSGDYQPTVEALKATFNEDLVVQFSANAYPCKSSEFRLQPASVVSIKYLSGV